MVCNYTHSNLEVEVDSIAGHYMPWKEAIVEFEGRKALYIVGRAIVENSCCGVANYNYVSVPGFLLGWHEEKDASGCPVSKIEPIKDKHTRSALREIISRLENTTAIEFW